MILCGGLARTDNKSHASLTPFSFGVETHNWSHYKQTSRASGLYCRGHELYAIGKFLFSRCFSSRFFFRRFLCDQLPSANKNILPEMRGEKAVFTTPPIVLRTPACRRSEPALNQYSRRRCCIFLAKTMRNWSRRELFAERAFFRRGVRVFTSRKRVGVGAPRTLYVSDVLSLHMLRTASAIRSPALVVLMAFEVEPSFTLF